MCYKKQTEGFAQEIIDLLEKHHLVLESTLRRTLTSALILLRNRGQVTAIQLLPLFFRCG